MSVPSALPRPRPPAQSLIAPAPPRSPFASLLNGSSPPKVLISSEPPQAVPSGVTKEPRSEPLTPPIGEAVSISSFEAAASGLLVEQNPSKPDIEGVFAATVSRIAWGGVPHAPLVHIELAHSSLAGRELLVERNARGIRVRLVGLSAGDRDRYREAIARRLHRARLPVDEIDVE